MVASGGGPVELAGGWLAQASSCCCNYWQARKVVSRIPVLLPLSGKMALNHKRYEGFHLFLVNRVLLGEMPQHQPFLLLEFDPEADAHHNETQPGT
jgi:hypothetical protein